MSNGKIDKWAKSPIMFALIVIVHIAIILYLSLSTETYLLSTYPATIQDNVFVVDGEILIASEEIYFYTEKNDSVLSGQIEYYQYVNGKTYIYIDGEMFFLQQKPNNTIMIEIPAAKTTLFNRLFINGGNVNEQ